MDNIKLAPNVLQLLDLLNAKKEKIFILSDFYLGKRIEATAWEFVGC